jgi:hypothetical protein
MGKFRLDKRTKQVVAIKIIDLESAEDDIDDIRTSYVLYMEPYIICVHYWIHDPIGSLVFQTDKSMNTISDDF